MTEAEIWQAIASDMPRTWEFHDSSGAWFGRDTATSLDDAVRVATEWVQHDAEWRLLAPETVTITVHCLATSERAQTTITTI